MAQSGQISLYPQSIDNGTVYACVLASGTCYSGQAGFTRGAAKSLITFNWNLADDGTLSVSFSHGDNATWCVCSNQGYHLSVDVSYDNKASWTNIMHAWANNWPTCDTCYNGKPNQVQEIARTLASMLTPYKLTQSGYVRIRMWTQSACPTCGCGSFGGCFPNAFPNDAGSSWPDTSIWFDVAWDARLKYDANGGTGAPADTVKTVSGADSTTVTVASGTPTRTNYRFEGWADSSTATSPQYHAGSSITINKSSPTKTIYAVWEKYYRPGAILGAGQWKTHDRDPNGAASIYTGSNWKEMRTIKGPTEAGDPPQMRHNSGNKNMRKIGSA